MFKRRPQTKPATPLRSSSRRQLLALLQTLYPILHTAPPELLGQLVPEGIKQCSALTSLGVKVVIYSEPGSSSQSGRPLWFEAGNENGAWVSGNKKGSAPAQSVKGREGGEKKYEIFPSIFTLWLAPNLLPVLPTWAQVIDPTLLGGSALMIPGLIPAPDTYALSSSHPSLPLKNALVAITAYPDNVPQVLARLEMDMKDMVDLREQGAKGKAAIILHSYQDGLWSLGPVESHGQLPEMVVPIPDGKEDQDGVGVDGEGMEALGTAVEQTSLAEDDEAAVAANRASLEAIEPSITIFDTTEVDTILNIALLSVIQTVAGSADPNLLPMSASAFYSSYILVHRPSHWPPRPVKGKRSRKYTSKGDPGSFGDGSNNSIPLVTEEERMISQEQVVVGRTSAKKLSRWLKTMEKDKGLIKTKEHRGEMNVVEVFASHDDVKTLTPFQTLAEWQAMQTLSSEGSEAQVETSSTASSTPGTLVHVEHFYSPSPAGIEFFRQLGLPPSETQDLYVPESVHKMITNYINAHTVSLPRNQSLVLPDEALYEHLQLPCKTGEPRSWKRGELHRLLLDKCTLSHHCISRLFPKSVEVLNASSNSNVDDPFRRTSLLTLTKGEHLGKLLKGAPPGSTCTGNGGTGRAATGWIVIKIRKRQGNKAVSLVSGLEKAYINPDRFATEVMRQFSTSISVNTLLGSSTKNPVKEVLVQGDQRKGLINRLVKENGVLRELITIEDAVGK